MIGPRVGVEKSSSSIGVRQWPRVKRAEEGNMCHGLGLLPLAVILSGQPAFRIFWNRWRLSKSGAPGVREINQKTSPPASELHCGTEMKHVTDLLQVVALITVIVSYRHAALRPISTILILTLSFKSLSVTRSWRGSRSPVMPWFRLLSRTQFHIRLSPS